MRVTMNREHWAKKNMKEKLEAKRAAAVAKLAELQDALYRAGLAGAPEEKIATLRSQVLAALALREGLDRLLPRRTSESLTEDRQTKATSHS
jgi:hypothetical protein